MDATQTVTDAITETIDEMLRSGCAVGDGHQMVDVSKVAVTAAAGSVLEETVRTLAPKACIEVGCASALSTLHICRGRLQAGPVRPVSMHVMDPKQTTHWKNVGRRALLRAGVLGGSVVLYEEPAHAVLPRLLADDTRVQFAFIDGWHMLDYVMVEAFYCDRMLDAGGVIALHDLWMPALQAFAAFWCTNRAYEPVTVQAGRLTTQTSPVATRVVGDLEQSFPAFRDRVAPYVDHSVLLLRKLADDTRRWNEYRDFCST